MYIGYCLATDKGTTYSHNMYPANIILLDLTMLDRSSIPALFINSSAVTRSCHEMPNMVCRHPQWKTSNMYEISVVHFHVLAM